MILYFGFLLEIKNLCLQQVEDFSASDTALTESRLGVHKELERDTARTADPEWPTSHTIWYVPYYIVSCSAIRAGWKEWGGRYLEWWHLSSHVTITHEPCFTGSGWTPSWWWEAVNQFLLLCLCVQFFALPCKLSLSQPMSLYFYLRDAGVKPQHLEQGGVSTRNV